MRQEDVRRGGLVEWLSRDVYAEGAKQEAREVGRRDDGVGPFGREDVERLEQARDRRGGRPPRRRAAGRELADHAAEGGAHRACADERDAVAVGGREAERAREFLFGKRVVDDVAVLVRRRDLLVEAPVGQRGRGGARQCSDCRTGRCDAHQPNANHVSHCRPSPRLLRDPGPSLSRPDGVGAGACARPSYPCSAGSQCAAKPI